MNSTLRFTASLLMTVATWALFACKDNDRPTPPYVKLATTSARPLWGEAFELTWRTRGAVGCMSFGDWSGERGTSGTYRTTALRADTRYELECTGAGGSTRAAIKVEAVNAPDAPNFPLRVDKARSALVMQRGAPFLMHGDAAWSLIAQLTPEEVDAYLADRRARGFNTLLVNLLEHKFADRAPANIFGELPFLKPADFRAPNPVYFSYAQWVVRRAEEAGFLVVLVPSYLGFEGKSEGWESEMVHAGTAVLRDYGRFVGALFAEHPNIMWAHGGDRNPTDLNLIREMVLGIREAGANQLATAHCAPETAAADFWPGESWLDINSVYSYRDVRDAALRQFSTRSKMPFFLIESHYENTPEISARQIRIQAYHALLSGAHGQIFGNHPIWHFSGPGYYKVSMTWREALSSRGAIDMANLRDLFSSRPWWSLQPDLAQTTLVDRFPWWSQRAIAAVTADKALAVVYVPRQMSVTLDLGSLRGSQIRSTWFDPTDGGYVAAAATHLPAKGTRSFAPPGPNAAGDGDWLLILESAPAVVSKPALGARGFDGVSADAQEVPTAGPG